MNFLKSIAATFLAFFLPGAFTRFALFSLMNITDRPVDYFGGLASCVGTSLVLTLFVMTLPRFLVPKVRMVLAIFIACFYYVNLEYIPELDSNFSIMMLHFLADKEFVQGSMFQVGHPLILSLCLLTAVSFAFLARKQVSLTRSHQTMVAVMAVAFLVLPYITFNQAYRRWRQIDPLQFNGELMFGIAQAVLASPNDDGDTGPNSWLTKDLGDPSPDIALRLNQDFGADLGGEPSNILSERPAKPNILMVIVESLAGSYLKSIAGSSAVAQCPFPSLDKFASETVVYRNFLNESKKTDRGEFALLCGRSPDMFSTTAKMTSYMSADVREECLPSVLQRNGYSTAYVQAANLSFMNKDTFMEKAGFGLVHGLTWFREFHRKNGWGVDDQTLYENAFKVIEDLDHKGQPWFLATLNIGTHHPGLPPEDWQSKYPTQIAAACASADEALSDFLTKFMRSKMAKNTLLMIASDESRTADVGTDAKRQMTLHWGTMLVKTPKSKPAVIDKLFKQSDVALSVLDYLGKSEQNTSFIGRSMFRTYDSPRSAVFGTFTSGTLWAYDGVESLTQCEMNAEKCQAFQLEKAPLFQQTLSTNSTVKPTEVEYIGQFVRKNELNSLPGTKGKDSFAIARTAPFSIYRRDGYQKLAHGEIDHVPPGTKIVIDVEVETLEGEADMRFEHRNIEADGMKPVTFREVGPRTLSADGKVKIKYAVLTAKPYRNMSFFLDVRSTVEHSKVKFRTANLTLEKAGNIVVLDTDTLIRNEFEISSKDHG